MSAKIWTTLIAIAFIAVAGAFYLVVVERDTVQTAVAPTAPPLNAAVKPNSDEEVKRQTIEGIGSVDRLSKVDLNAASSKKRTP
jgi:hypothetical protein